MKTILRTTIVILVMLMTLSCSNDDCSKPEPKLSQFTSHINSGEVVSGEVPQLTRVEGNVYMLHTAQYKIASVQRVECNLNFPPIPTFFNFPFEYTISEDGHTAYIYLDEERYNNFQEYFDTASINVLSNILI